MKRAKPHFTRAFGMHECTLPSGARGIAATPEQALAFAEHAKRVSAGLREAATKRTVVPHVGGLKPSRRLGPNEVAIDRDLLQRLLRPPKDDEGDGVLRFGGPRRLRPNTRIFC